ncbi:Na/Pi cotransporter family protein [bacterium]|nr:Na/Pi cotransporter family protein [bacterium]
MLRAFIFVFGGLGIFAWGMNIMSEGLQELAGKRLKNLMAAMTKNRFLGILSGLLTTALIQSSSATTVMLVSFVNTGLVTLTGAIPVIMGANIGTTMTGWIVALFGFKVSIKYVALLCCGFGFFMGFLTKDLVKKKIAKFMRGFGILFLGLEFMKDAFHGYHALDQNMDFVNFISSYSVTHGNYLNFFICVIVGSVFTMVFQSSSAMMAATMVLASSGVIDFRTACAIILGENIGTTITAFVASIGANNNARRTAVVHVIFNVLGVIWMTGVFWWFTNLIDYIVPGNPCFFETSESGNFYPFINSHLALFHTLFNITNTLLFVSLTKQLRNIARYLIKGEKEEPFQLKYIDSSIAYPTSIAVNQAHEEVLNMYEVTYDMYQNTMKVFRNPHVKMIKSIDEVRKEEEKVDFYDKNIQEFLSKIIPNSTSLDVAKQITSLLDISSNIERIADHCDRFMILLERLYKDKLTLSNKAVENIKEISAVVKEFLDFTYECLKDWQAKCINDAYLFENKINDMRKRFRNSHLKGMMDGDYSVAAGMLFIDILASFEKMGDHLINIHDSINA